MHINIGIIIVCGTWIAFLIVVALLFLSLKRNKFRLLNGILGNTALLLLIAAGSFSILHSQIIWLEDLMLVVAAIVIIPIILLYFSLGILLLWNAVIVWRRESHSLGNMLTLILGILLVISPLFFDFLKMVLPGPIAQAIINTIVFFAAYAAFWLLNFITSFLITRLSRPKWDKQYIIVLGSGLINGNTVSPLLASRILRAKEFYEQQVKRTNLKPVIIFSGGQGANETMSEGQAMKEYAMANGMADYDLVAETESKNTYQNMLFSKKIVEKRGLDLQKGIFATSDYHTFRAAGYARYVGLNIDGIGAKTSKFFIPNAFIREYIAILMNHKVFHIAALTIFVITNIAVTILDAKINGGF